MSNHKFQSKPGTISATFVGAIIVMICNQVLPEGDIRRAGLLLSPGITFVIVTAWAAIQYICRSYFITFIEKRANNERKKLLEDMLRDEHLTQEDKIKAKYTYARSRMKAQQTGSIAEMSFDSNINKAS